MGGGLEPISKIIFGHFRHILAAKSSDFVGIVHTIPPQSSLFSLNISSKLAQSYF